MRNFACNILSRQGSHLQPFLHLMQEKLNENRNAHIQKVIFAVEQNDSS